MRPAVAPILATLGLMLGCAGLLGPEEEPVAPVPPALQQIDADRLAGNFARADNALDRHLEAHPEDAAAHKLRGDLNLSRGQRYQRRWKENLLRARDSYRDALSIDPTDCAIWSRAAFAVAAGARHPETATPALWIDSLPREAAAEHCSGAALLLLAELRPREDRLAHAREQLGPEASDMEVLAQAAPDLVQAASAIHTKGWEWTQTPMPSLEIGRPFVMLDTPVRAQGVASARPRTVEQAEWIAIGDLRGDEVVFTDRKLPARRPHTGRVEAVACPGTTWRMGADNRPIGACRAGAWIPGKSRIYNEELLRKAGPVHYAFSSVPGAAVPPEEIISSSVRCRKGGFGPMFEQMPSCRVDYDEPIYQLRSVPRAAGFAAWDEAHAQSLLEAHSWRELYGPEVADSMGRGRVAQGMPYAMFLHGRPSVAGCVGRPLMQRAVLRDGALVFSCEIGGWSYRFRELRLSAYGPAEGG